VCGRSLFGLVVVLLLLDEPTYPEKSNDASLATLPSLASSSWIHGRQFQTGLRTDIVAICTYVPR
jgi:hypothetical protein